MAGGTANLAAAVPLLDRPLVSGIVEARFRPEAGRLVPAGQAALPGQVVFHGEVTAVSYPGGHWRHAVHLGEHEVLADAERAFAPGEKADVHVAAESLFLFNPPDAAPVSSISRAPAGEVHA